MSQNEPILLDVSIKELFVPLINSAGQDLKFDLNPIAESYLLSILEEGVFTTSIFVKNNDRGVYEEPMLSERFLKALQEEQNKRKCAELKKLGDSILLKAGFFADALKRKISGLNFHIQMGSSVYGNLYSGSKNPVHEDLSQRFSGYVDLISKIGQKINLKGEEDILMLFDRVIEAESEDAKSSLIRMGCVPNVVKKVSNQ